MHSEKRWSESVAHCFGVLFCRSKRRTDDNGFWIHPKLIQIVYHMLTTAELPLTPIASNSIWHKSAPLKVCFIVRRLFHNHIPTNDNLLRRDIIQQDFVLCVSGCEAKELVDYLFLRCNFFGSIWHTIQRWIGIVYVDPLLLSDHFRQFGQLG